MPLKRQLVQHVQTLDCLAAHEPRHDIGRAVLLRRLDIGAAQQHSPTRKRFMVTKRVIIFRKGAIHEPQAPSKDLQWGD